MSNRIIFMSFDIFEQIGDGDSKVELGFSITTVLRRLECNLSWCHCVSHGFHSIAFIAFQYARSCSLFASPALQYSIAALASSCVGFVYGAGSPSSSVQLNRWPSGEQRMVHEGYLGSPVITEGRQFVHIMDTMATPSTIATPPIMTSAEAPFMVQRLPV